MLTFIQSVMELRLLLMNLYGVVVSVLVIGESNDDDRTYAVVHTVVTNTAKPSI